MVVYEVPFSRYNRFAAVARILRGECLERPQGVEGSWFTDDVWSVLGYCWKPPPEHQRCTPMFGGRFGVLDATISSWGR